MLVRRRWPHMKEMKRSHETGGPLTPHGPVCWLNTHTLAHAGTEQPLSCASESPDGPSVSPLCPAGRRASGAHRSPAQFSTSSLAGARRTASPVEDQTRTLSLSSCCSAATLPLKRKGWGEKKVCQSPRSRDKPNATHIQTRFKRPWRTSPSIPTWAGASLAEASPLSPARGLRWYDGGTRQRRRQDGMSDEAFGGIAKARKKAETWS